MPQTDLVTRADTFRALHLAGGLILPNAWDVASARIVEAAGFPAVATSSASVAFARGFRDDGSIGRDAMLREVALIASRVSVPVSADVEAGYGPTLADVEATVAGVIAAGAVGINLEDAIPGGAPAPLFGLEDAAGRVATARATAERLGVPIVINARTDPFLLALGDSDEERLAIAIERGRAYLAAGADIVFVPGVRDPALVRRLADGIGGPLSLMVGPGAPPAAELFAAGARRISLGPHTMLAALGTLRAIAGEARRSGTWTELGRHHVPFDELESLMG